MKKSPRRDASPAGDAAALARRVLAGDRAAAARAISLLEDGGPGAEELLKRLYPATGRARVIGVTGAPGVGKSTLTAALIGESVRAGRRTGALLVDPSSPVSGGAVLGDRLRLGDRAGDASLFVRSLASRGAVGGLAASVWGARRVLEAMGLETVFIETVGAGQADVDVARCADAVVVVTAPGLGDEVQALKAGILEIADVLVVNKADLPGKEQALAALRSFWLSEEKTSRRPLLAVAALSGEGVPALWKAVSAVAERLETSAEGRERRRRQAEAEILAAVERLRAGAAPAAAREAELLLARKTDPVSAGRRVLARWAGAGGKNGKR